MDPVFDLIREFEPETPRPTTTARRRQRDALTRVIAGDQRDLSASRGRRRLLRRGPVVGVVVGVLAAAGGGIAAAVTLLTPTPQQATSIYGNYYPGGGAGHLAGTRPDLNAEEVLCDYRGAGGLPTSVRDGALGDGFASSAPLTTPLTAQMLLDACDTVSTTGAAVPPSVPATLCVTSEASTVTDTQAGWPVVVFGGTTCASEGDATAPATLLDQVNQRRADEATIDAVPQSCPTEAQALDWVHQQLSVLGLSMQVMARDGGPGGTCYLPYVQWWWPPTGAPLVQITASQQAGNPSGSATTTTLPQ